MSGYYTYFIASLPMLQFGGKPPFSFEEFIERCRSVIDEDGVKQIQCTREHALNVDRGSNTALRRCFAIESALRSELAKIRARRMEKDAGSVVHQRYYPEKELLRIATKASRMPSPIDAEKLLDEYRWQVLDELSLGHYFDLDFLIVYARKLLIVERWQRIRRADAQKEIDSAVAAVTQTA